MIYIVSMGPGSDELIAPLALKRINEASEVYCAERYARFVPEEKMRPITPISRALEGISRAKANGTDAAVLVSGDAGLYSMLETIKRVIGADGISVVPGISSLSAFCAELNISWQDARILSGHGRELSQAGLCHCARTNKKTLVLLDGERNPRRVRDALARGGLDGVKLYIGERVSCPDMRVGLFEDREYDPLSVACIINDAPDTEAAIIGIPDEEFIRAKTPMTKRAIRMQVINELRLRPGSVVWDIGSGTGSVSVECARQCPEGAVYAIERDEEAFKLTELNAERFHALNLTAIKGSAPEALSGLPAPTHVFLGGSGGRTKEIFALLEGLRVPIRICATAVTVETESELLQIMSGYKRFTANQIAVNSIEKLGAYHMRRAGNPVTVFAAEIGG